MPVDHSGSSLRSKRVDDHVVRGGHERTGERGVRRDVDGVGGAVTLPLHDRDHDATHGRGIRYGRTRDAAEQCGCQYVREPQAPLPVTDEAAGEVHDFVGDTSMQHQLARKDKEGNGEEREHVHAGDHHLDRCFKRQAFNGKCRQATQPDREGDRDAQQQENNEAQTQNGQFHDGTTSFPLSRAITCSTENSVMRTPAIKIGA